MPLLLLFGVVAVALSAAVFIAPIIVVVMVVRAARSGRSTEPTTIDTGVAGTAVAPVP